MSQIRDIHTTRREDRVKQTAEVFTPPRIVHQMLSKLPKEVWKKGKTFCDPACGNGNFLIAVLWRKIERNHNALEALQCVFGVDIMRDNILECRLRLLKIVSLYEEITEDHIKAVFTNIVWINKNKYENGSLDYDFSFNNKLNQRDIDRWMTWISDGKLTEVNLPVEEEVFGTPSQDLFEDDFK